MSSYPRNRAVYKIYDISSQGRAKGTLMGIVYRDQIGGEQLGDTVESGNIKEVHDSAQRIARAEGYPFAEYVGYKIEKM